MTTAIKPMPAPTFAAPVPAPRPAATQPAPAPHRADASRSDGARKPDNRRRQHLVKSGYSIAVKFNAGDDVEVQVLMRNGQWQSVAGSRLNPGTTTVSFSKSDVDLTKGWPQIRLVNHTTNTTLVDYDPTAVHKQIVGGATVMNWEDRSGWPGQNDFSNVGVTLTPTWGTPKPLAPSPAPAPKPAPKPTHGRKLTQVVEHDLRVIERWSTQKNSVRLEALRDVFLFLKSEVFAQSNAQIKNTLSQLEAIFGELQSVLPPGAFDRLGAVLRSLSVKGEAFFVSETHSAMYGHYAKDDEDLPRLGIMWSHFAGQPPEQFNACLMHEMIHFAFDSPSTRHTATKMLDNPLFQQLAKDAAPNPHGRGWLSFGFAKQGLIEAIANDPLMRTSLKSGLLDVVGPGLQVFLSEFGKAFRRNLPKGPARATFGNLSTVFWGAAGMMPAGTWKYDAELAKTFAQKVGKAITFKYPDGKSGYITVTIKPEDTWMTAFWKYGRAYQGHADGG